MRLISFLFDIVSIVVLKIFHFLFSRLTVYGKDNFKKIDGPVIIIANHSSMLDPFTMVTAIPFRYMYKVLPMRFAMNYRIYNMLLLKPFLYLWGCYPVYPKTGDLAHVLKPTIAITNDLSSKSIIIFPEGKVEKNNIRPNARPGAAYVARESKWQILPVGINGTHSTTVFKFFTFRNKYTVRFGEPFHFNDISDDKEDLREVAKKIMNRAYDLMKEDNGND